MSWTNLHVERRDEIRRVRDSVGSIAFSIGDGLAISMPREVAERLRDALTAALATPPERDGGADDA